MMQDRVDLSLCVIIDKWAIDLQSNHDERSNTQSLHFSIYINAGSIHHLSLSNYVSSSFSYCHQCLRMNLLSLASPSSTFQPLASGMSFHPCFSV